MSRPDPPEKAFCTTREAAKILGVSLRTVQLWTGAGLLEAWKTQGGHRRIVRSSVEGLLSRRPPDTGPSRAADATLRILVVDDDAVLLRVCERQMARWPMKPQVVTVQNGYEALVRVGLAKPDLLITDLRMPAMDGFAMLRQLRTMPELAEITIVVVTGLAPEEVEADGGVPAGIPILPKPIPFDRLLDIATVLASRKQQASQVPIRP